MYGMMAGTETTRSKKNAAKKKRASAMT